ncbi:uncharacterized protein LOC121763905 [Salvia splendens]|uniref:uncharacterized protein LOC121763905 n=1 Tax=Salvia splendens TaxID=180675 RepID=UPI001C25FCE0|nr:uncharacterized protein LOC121763905 [Salvia splendens]
MQVLDCVSLYSLIIRLSLDKGYLENCTKCRFLEGKIHLIIRFSLSLLVARTRPFVDPFFTSNFGSISGPPGRKQISIEGLNPDDDGSGDAKSLPKQSLTVKNSNEYPSDYQSFSFQRVAYGGPDGIYYTSSVGRRAGGDGVFLMEMKEDD